MRWIVGLIFPLLLSGLSLNAQRLKLESLTIEDGLSQGMIFDILQDRDGFLWVATKDGLNRYDGYSFKIFSHSTLDRYSLSGHIPSVLFEDSRGWLWVGTENNGLNVFDKHTERFYHLSSSTGSRHTLQSNTIHALQEDAAGNIWVGSDAGVDRVLIPKAFQLSSQPSAELDGRLRVTQEMESLPGVNCLYFKGDKVRVGTNTGLYERSITGRETPKNYLQGIESREPSEQWGVFDIFEDKYGAIWLARKYGLTRLMGGKVEHFPVSISPRLPRIRVAQSADGNLLLAYTKLQHLTIGPKGIASIEELMAFDGYSCTKLFIDKSGLWWMGTNGFGLRKYNTRASDFNHFMPGASVQQIFEDRQGLLWIWANFRLQCLDPQTGLSSQPAGFPAHLLRARKVYQDRAGRYWFHMPFVETGKKIICFDPQTKLVKEYPYTQEEDPLTPFLEDRQGNIWLGCIGGFVMKLDIRQDRFVYYAFHHLFTQNDPGLKVTTLYQDRQGVFWLGTPLGLVRMEERAGQTPQFTAYKSKVGGLSENYILSILEDPGVDNVFWIGTKGGGINRFDAGANTFSHVSTADGLPNHVVYGILPDDSNAELGMNLWLSTNRGLSCYNPTAGSFKNYLAADGLQDNEFNTAAYAKLRSGELVFGGINGVNIFLPQQIRGNDLPPAVFITNMRVNNKAVDFADSTILTRVIEFSPAIRLRHDENMISFVFSTLDFVAPEKNTYEYQMLGLETDWVKAGNRREVVYTNLPPGDYVFRVRGANSSGVWSEKIAEVSIRVQPPWWRTGWASFLWVSMAGVLVYLLYHFQVNRIKMKNRLLFEQKEAERLAEISRMKTNFFSNITHEFRTPLTLIIEPLRQALPQLKDDPQTYEKVEIAEKNSRQLLWLVNQLLDLSKLESGAMQLDLNAGDIEDTIHGVFVGFLPLAKKKHIRLTYEAPQKLSPFYFDQSKVELVLNNLISNALKFTNPGGEIIISADRADQSAIIRISDTGIGIPADSLPKIFDRFYQVPPQDVQAFAGGGGTTQPDPLAANEQMHPFPAEQERGSAAGTGIGLALTKELVRLMGGSIRVVSELGKGTTFTVSLSMIGATAASGAGEMRDKMAPTEPEVAAIPVLELSASDSPYPLRTKKEAPWVLLIEDNADLRHFIRQSISAHYRVIEASDGGEGVEKALKLIPDLIISDLMMPVKNGYVVCDELKTNELTSHIPIILLTAKGDLDHKIRGLRAGADDYLTKPFYTEELLARMSNLIDIRNLLRKKNSHSWQVEEAATGENTEASFSKTDQEFLKKITSLLEDQLEDETLSVEDVAKKLFISRVQLHRKLKALTDQPANTFIRNYRLDRALKMLKNKEGNVTEIAVRTGFASQKYFSVRFKERFGVSPSEVE